VSPAERVASAHPERARDQLRAALREGGHRDGAVVDARSPSATDLAREHQIVGIPVCEDSLDARAIRAVTDHARSDAAAAHGDECVDEHRLACPRLAGEDDEPRSKLEAEVRNEREVLHRELRDVAAAHE